jgi:hypothetical protein
MLRKGALCLYLTRLLLVNPFQACAAFMVWQLDQPWKFDGAVSSFGSAVLWNK